MKPATILVSILLLSSALVQPLAGESTQRESPKPAEGKEGGKWQLSVAAAADGTTVIVASLPAEAPIVSGFAKVTPRLILRYGAGRTSACVLFDTFLGSGTVEVTLRIGANTTKERWRISSDGRAVFAPGDALAFMSRLKQADTFAIMVARAKGEAVAAEFSTAGIEIVIKALISAGVRYG